MNKRYNKKKDIKWLIYFNYKKYMAFYVHQRTFDPFLPKEKKKQ